MNRALQHEYWDRFFTQKKTLTHEPTRTDILMSIFCDAIEMRFQINKNKGKIIEVGCGGALFSRVMASKGYKTFSVDFSRKALTLAKEYFSQESLAGSIVCGDAMFLPFQSGTFDMIYNAGLIDIYDHPIQPLKEMNRVLKDEGILISIIPTRRFSIQTVADAYNGVVYKVRSLLGGHSLIWNEYRKNLSHAKNLPISQYMGAFEEAGLEVLQFTTGYVFPELSLPKRLKRLYIRWLARNSDMIARQLFSDNPIRVFLGTYYFVFARSMK